MDKNLKQLARLQHMINSAGVGTWEWNLQTGELRLNEVWARLIGYTLAELHPISIQTWIDHVHPDDYHQVNAILERVFKREISEYKCDIRMRHKQGHWLWMRDTGQVFSHTADGKPEWVIGMHVDITDSKLIEQKVNEQQVTLERAQQIGRLGYWTSTLEVDELFWSSKIYKTIGLNEKQTQPCIDLFRSLVHPDDRELFETHMKALINGEGFDFEHRLIRADGTVIWVHQRAEKTALNGRDLYIGTMLNVTPTKQIEMQLTELSQTDELTRIYNRRYLLHRLRQALNNPDEQPAVLALLDIDYFKNINDTYGHDAGDSALVQFSQFLHDNIRTSDVVARTGGEEFVVLMLNTDIDRALSVLQNLMAGIRRLPITLDARTINITSTMGITEIQPTDKDTNKILVRADQALYRGKNNGRNQIVMN